MMRYCARKAHNRLSSECRVKVLEALSSGLSVQTVAQNFRISAATVIRIVNRNGAVNARLALPQSYTKPRSRKLKWPQLDEALLHWCGALLAEGGEINTVILREQAISLAQQFGLTGFSRYASSWICQWNQKHGIVRGSVNLMLTSRMRKRKRMLPLRRWRTMAISRTAATSELSDRNPPGVGSRFKETTNGVCGKRRVSDALVDNDRTQFNHSDTDSTLVNGKLSASGRPRKQRIMDSDSINCSKERLSHGSTAVPRCVPFEWTSYLKELSASAVPTSFFSHVPSEVQKECKLGRLGSHIVTEVLFKPDQYLEGVDPHHESLFCALKVAEVVGRRVRLRFVGYPERYDFWTTVDSPFLFPVGWCAHNRRQLQPPKPYLERDQPEFDWDSFLTKGKCSAVPHSAFKSLWDAPSDVCPAHNFRVGYKLEAVDKRNPAAVCVATVNDCIGDYVLIHFDGWDCGFDQWAHISSNLLHPIGYCEEQELVLSIPTDWSTKPSGFTWKQYLKENNAKPVPNEAFIKASTLALSVDSVLEVGQRLEAVDRRCPQLVRVANVVATGPPGFFTIGYDGWPDKFNVCLESSCPDLFPVGYCQATDHPLQPPPGYDLDDFVGLPGDAQSNSSASSLSGGGGSSSTQTVSCPTVGCKGYGNAKGPKHTTHQRLSGCPYSDVNLKRDLIRAYDRLNITSVVPTIPDSTSPITTQMPKLEQQTSTLVAFDRPGSVHQHASPDSSVRTDPFVSRRSPSPIQSATALSGLTLSTLCPSSSSSCSSASNLTTSTKPSGDSEGPVTNSNSVPPAPSDSPASVSACSLPGRVSTPPDVPSSVHTPTEVKVGTAPLDLSVDRDKHHVLHDKPPDLREAVHDIGSYSNTTNGLFKSCNSESAPPALFPDTSHQVNIPGTYEVIRMGEAQSLVMSDALSNFKVTVGGHLGDVEMKSNYAALSSREGKPCPPRLSQPAFGSVLTPPASIPPHSHNYARHHQQQSQQQQPPQHNQSMASGMAGLPIKRKRGRPRKYATVHVLHATQTHTRAIQPFSPLPTASLSSAAPQSPAVTTLNVTNPSYPYSTLLLGQQQASSMTQCTSIPPTLTRYAPLTVSAPPQSSGMIVTNATSNGCNSGHPVLMSPEPTQLSQNQSFLDHSTTLPTRPLSPMTVSVVDANCTNSTGNNTTTGLSPQSTSTEPAVHQRGADSNVPVCTSGSPGVVSASTTPTGPYPPLDFCTAQHTLNGLFPYVNGLMPSHVPIPSPKLPDPSLPSVLGWCTDSLSLNGSYQLTLATQSNTSMFVPPFTGLSGQRCNIPNSSDASGVPYTRHSSLRDPPSGMGIWSGSDLDLMGRLLPQASAAIRAAKVAGLPGPHSWSAEMVGNFVSTLPGCKQFANKFVENEIDGAALLCLEQHDLMQILGMKLGPAVKVFSAIQTLRRSLMATPLTELGLEHPSAMEAASSCFSVRHVSHTELNVPSSNPSTTYSDQKPIDSLNESGSMCISSQSMS